MLFRFSLYGFLKNQRYFEPFLVLAFLDKGLSFFQIGLLIGFREIAINVVEVPSGAFADLSGRRRAMVVSMAAYIASFTVLALASHLAVLFLAMALFACGDAFRTGTHKAMILDWLRRQGRAAEKTRIYGHTRSWSKLGSALSALIAAALVLVTAEYSIVFWLSIVPYGVNLANLATYPANLDGQRRTTGTGSVLRHLKQTFAEVACTRSLRRLALESMGYEGVHAVVKDYLQPLLRAAALGLPVLLWLDGERRTAVLIGVTYCLLNLIGSFASRRAHRVQDLFGGEERAARWLWLLTGACYTALLPLLLFGHASMAIGLFVALAALQNIWRPILVARFDAGSRAEAGATILSVEAQAKSLGAMILAPLVGFAVDLSVQGSGEASVADLWPIAIPGLAAALLFFFWRAPQLTDSSTG